MYLAIVVYSLVTRWPYNFTPTLRHYRFDTVGGYAPLWNSVYVAALTAVVGTVLNALYGTLAILIVSNVIHYFTVGFLTATTALRQMDGEFENVSASLGVPFYRTFWRVTVPMALPSIVAISMYFFLNAMVTLSAVVFLVAPGTELAAVAVLLMDDAGDAAQAAAMSVCIVGIGLAVRLGYWALMRGVDRRTQAWRESREAPTGAP